MKKSTIAVIVILLLAACGFGGWRYHEAQIAKMQEAGVESLKASISLDDYRENEQKSINAILEKSEADIRECREQEKIDKIISESSEAFKEFKTDAELTAEEEAARQAELERQRKEEEERLAAERAAAAARSRSKSRSGGSGSRNGCVGGGSDVFN